MKIFSIMMKLIIILLMKKMMKKIFYNNNVNNFKNFDEEEKIMIHLINITILENLKNKI